MTECTKIDKIDMATESESDKEEMNDSKTNGEIPRSSVKCDRKIDSETRKRSSDKMHQILHSMIF